MTIPKIINKKTLKGLKIAENAKPKKNSPPRGGRHARTAPESSAGVITNPWMPIHTQGHRTNIFLSMVTMVVNKLAILVKILGQTLGLHVVHRQSRPPALTLPLVPINTMLCLLASQHGI